MATMTRAHFQVIADAILLAKKTVAENEKGNGVPYDAMSALGLLTIIMADGLYKTNPQFSFSKFYDACSLVDYIEEQLNK